MNVLNNVHISLVLPMGAHFYHNIYQQTYKEFISFLYKISCYAVNQKCCSCPFSKECKYYHCTGENFLNYPGIIIHNPIFSKSIYAHEEKLDFDFYLVGNNSQYISYIKLFFESYLNQKISGHYFYLKEIKVNKVREEKIETNHFLITTPIESTELIKSYNNMITYYNQAYETHYDSDTLKNIDVLRKKEIALDSITFKTKKVYLKGYGYLAKSNNQFSLNSHFSLIGIGKYNFIGGGHIET